MKKLLISILSATLLLPILAGCTTSPEEGTTTESASAQEQSDAPTTESTDPTQPAEPTTEKPREKSELEKSFTEEMRTMPVTDGLIFKEGFRRGVNLGNIMEAPDEGEWGVWFDDDYIPMIKQKGFDFIRLPVSWSTRLTLDGTAVQKLFVERIAHIIDLSIKNELGVVVNIHHFNEMNSDPAGHADELYMIWKTISERFMDYPSSVIFEILNEPNTQLDTKTYNQYQNECINIIRKTNPTREIVISGGSWGGYNDLMDLEIIDDPNLVLSFHYYDPFNFTHQGASWTGGDMDQHLGTKWAGTETDKALMESTFRKVKEWAEAAGMPVLMGEFGALDTADMESRAKWTAHMRELAEKYGFAWSYWEFCAGFGIYNPNDEYFYDELVNALTGSPMPADFGSGSGVVKIDVVRENGKIGPFSVKRAIEGLYCDSWTNMMLDDTANSTQIVRITPDVSDWSQLFITLNDLKDTGDSFNYETAELTVRNIDNSITDFCINLDNNGDTETQLNWIGPDKIFKDTKDIIQNADGTTTLIFNLKGAYRALAGKCEAGIRIKMFVESVPDRAHNYDRAGEMEFIKLELK